MNSSIAPWLTDSRVPRHQAFSLLELLVTVAIIGTLGALLVPALSRMKQEGMKGACVLNLRTLGSVTQLIVADENGTLPGVGKRSANASATWQDVFNVWEFDSKGKDPLQRWGDRRLPGQMYCPAMQKWPAGGTRYPRAYVMNTYVQNNDPNATPIPSYNGLIDYLPGRKLAAFAHPQQTVMISESEREGDYVQPNIPYDQLTWGDGSSAPSWASADKSWAFRHLKQTNVLFLDGHVETLTFDQAKLLNDPVHFNPLKQ